MARTPEHDSDTESFRLAARVTRKYLIGARSLHDHIAAKLLNDGPSRVLDIGCGEGALSDALPDPPPFRLVGLDASAVLLRAHRPPRVRADALRLPFRDGTFGAAVAVNLLHHLDDPGRALREARRVLAPGGVLLVTAVCRTDSPELAPVWRPEPSGFDAEEAPARVCEVFGEVEVERWDAPLITLPDHGAVRDYLVARRVPRAEAAEAARRLRTPLPVTKRGSLVVARRAVDR
ncbi:class I SAM-dependent methyltransferase [Actinomadura chibensis]|uniref:Class I SAM-dependent methyltransferase n=1 Tax=Actinomadura chibensis TaxID=392828 RepID=A0A5D0N3X8_9ACTN|nr:class I SAM-dependent methyltransferase [Actinomadura chibensis]TYB38855.1 class I SAM-dependent methyltransferase [Actinomadura chibensis]